MPRPSRCSTRSSSAAVRESTRPACTPTGCRASGAAASGSLATGCSSAATGTGSASRPRAPTRPWAVWGKPGCRPGTSGPTSRPASVHSAPTGSTSSTYTATIPRGLPERSSRPSRSSPGKGSSVPAAARTGRPRESARRLRTPATTGAGGSRRARCSGISARARMKPPGDSTMKVMDDALLELHRTTGLAAVGIFLAGRRILQQGRRRGRPPPPGAAREPVRDPREPAAGRRPLPDRPRAGGAGVAPRARLAFLAGHPGAADRRVPHARAARRLDRGRPPPPRAGTGGASRCRGVRQEDPVNAPDRLRCEHLADPLGVDRANPRFSWHARSDRRAAVQAGYRIICSERRADVEAGAGHRVGHGVGRFRPEPPGAVGGQAAPQLHALLVAGGYPRRGGAARAPGAGSRSSRPAPSSRATGRRRGSRCRTRRRARRPCSW